MSLLHRFLATGAPAPQTYVDDVFSAYTYTGNGSTQTITNGIDLSTYGGLVWIKPRSTANPHALFDTIRGVTKRLQTNSTAAEDTASSSLTAFDSGGFSLGSDPNSYVNHNPFTYVSWTFREAPKFFDVVTYTGTGANRTIAHSLGQVPGMIVVKRTDTTGDWEVYHRSLANTEYMVLNTTAAKATDATMWNSTTPTASVFSLGTNTNVNASGGTYVAYLFAHDTSATGLIQCGSFVSSGGVDTINLGFEPQFLIYKSSSNISDWRTIDVNRGWSMSSNTLTLFPNLSNAEQNASVNGNPTATGFSFNTGATISGATYIYLAIRRPNKPPTLGTQVYNAIARTGTGAAATVTGVGFAPDLVIAEGRNYGSPAQWYDRLRGATALLKSNSQAAESTNSQGVATFGMNGFSVGTEAELNNSGSTFINWCLQRKVTVFDEVCYTGTGAVNNVSHSLGVTPELIIVKTRSAVTSWPVYNKDVGTNKWLELQGSGTPTTDALIWNNTAPTSSVFTVNSAVTNTSSSTYVAYLFATVLGISKVGSYTGNGSSQTINAGFTTGARWVMIRRTDVGGNWYVWDSTRGIVAGNDPWLLIDGSGGETTTDDSVDTDTSGFIVNQLAATNINVNAASYIFLSFS